MNDTPMHKPLVRNRERSPMKQSPEAETPSREKGYDVGYGRPPKSGQFKPGQSGNPKGRPRGSKNTATILQEELNARVKITENGQIKTIPKRRAAIKQQVNKAAAGQDRAFKQVFEMEQAHQIADEARQDRHGFNKKINPQELAEEDQRIIRDTVAKLSPRNLLEGHNDDNA